MNEKYVFKLQDVNRGEHFCCSAQRTFLPMTFTLGVESVIIFVLIFILTTKAPVS